MSNYLWKAIGIQITIPKQNVMPDRDGKKPCTIISIPLIPYVVKV